VVSHWSFLTNTPSAIIPKYGDAFQ
jgi:hypothetical protein